MLRVHEERSRDRCLFAFLNKYTNLSPGSGKKHSCNTAFISLLDKWLKNIDKGEITGAVFFDLRKAFDVVDNEILLKKLKSHKFDDRTMNWMKSYLTNRRQCIVDKTATSSFQQVTTGLSPQPSALSNFHK